MNPTITIAIVAFVLLLSIPGAAARRRRIGSGSSAYCVDDQNQRVPCVSSIIGAVIGGLCSCPNTTRVIVLTVPFSSSSPFDHHNHLCGYLSSPPFATTYGALAHDYRRQRPPGDEHYCLRLDLPLHGGPNSTPTPCVHGIPASGTRQPQH